MSLIGDIFACSKPCLKALPQAYRIDRTAVFSFGTAVAVIRCRSTGFTNCCPANEDEERKINPILRIHHQDVFNSQWQKIRGHARQWWGELTDDDLDEISGRRERLVGIIQKRYGRTREEAEVDINRFLVRVTSLLKLDQQ